MRQMKLENLEKSKQLIIWNRGSTYVLEADETSKSNITNDRQQCSLPNLKKEKRLGLILRCNLF